MKTLKRPQDVERRLSRLSLRSRRLEEELLSERARRAELEAKVDGVDARLKNVEGRGVVGG